MVEKLVEEIRELLVDGFYAFVLEKPKFRDADTVAKSIITRIGKAYADGELELPGEVGRGDYDDLPLGPPGETWGCNYIALRPLSGTSKQGEVGHEAM